MTADLCKTCGKPPVATRAGSVTSYFFQHNYCQCKSRQSSSSSISNSNSNWSLSAKPRESDSPVCSGCGKSRPVNRRAGSFTAFLFKELRCNCAASVPLRAVARVASDWSSGHTLTATRVAQRKQFTESARSQSLASGDSFAQAIHSPDTVIGGVFRIISLIGMGGMGVVYLVEHTALRRQFALKVLAAALVNEQSWLRFQAEAKILASLNHSIFVKVYDLGIHDQLVPFYSMDYLDGRSLEEILVHDQPLKLDQALNVFLEVLDGLAYAHRNGIVHRDIKPGNIMLCQAKVGSGVVAGSTVTVKVLDFGISKLISSAAGELQSLTSAGEIVGSPYYMSPEQCVGGLVDARSDIYSIGCTLFEVLTGFVPFEGQTSLETVLMHQELEPPRLSEVLPNSNFPPSLDLVLAKCLAKLPQDRYQSAKELALDLVRIKDGKDLLAYSPALGQRNALRVSSNSRSKTIIRALSSLFALLAIGGIGWFFFQNVGSDLSVEPGLRGGKQTLATIEPEQATGVLTFDDQLQKTLATIEPEQATEEFDAIEFDAILRAAIK